MSFFIDYNPFDIELVKAFRQVYKILRPWTQQDFRDFRKMYMAGEEL